MRTRSNRLRVAFERSGSPGWIMRLIAERGLDERHGFSLEILWWGDRMQQRLQATEAALFAGEADLIDTDWLSLAAHGRQGRSAVAIYPYGRIFGGLVVPAASPITELAQLTGRRLGVVHAGDKNWTITRRCLRAQCGDAVADGVVLVETGSKSVLREQLRDGPLDAALLYWHQVPEAVADGQCRLLHDVLELAARLVPEVPPTTYFVTRESFAASRPELCAGFCAAYREAVDMLRTEPGAWQRIHDECHGELSAAGLSLLRRSWAARVCDGWDTATLRHLDALSDQLVVADQPPAPSTAALFDQRFFHPAAAGCPSTAGVH